MARRAAWWALLALGCSAPRPGTDRYDGGRRDAAADAPGEVAAPPDAALDAVPDLIAPDGPGVDPPPDAPRDVPSDVLPVDAPPPSDAPRLDAPPPDASPPDASPDAPRLDAPPDAAPPADRPCVPSVEVCNGADDDCNGRVDDVAPERCAPRYGVCAGGRCECPAGYENCGGVCRPTGMSCVPANPCRPGAVRCAGTGTTCVADTAGAAAGPCALPSGARGVCEAGGCRCGGVTCAGRCVDTSAAPMDCGACGSSCGSNHVCVRGACERAPAAPGDLPSGPAPLFLTAPRVALRVDLADARSHVDGPCGGCRSGPDVFYAMRVTERSIVYVDAAGAAGSVADVTLAILTAGAAPRVIASAGLPDGRACADGPLPGCTGGERVTQVLAVLEPGTDYLLEVKACQSNASVDVHVEHAPVNASPAPLPVGPRTLTGSLTGAGSLGAAALGSACCATGPEAVYYWYSCVNSPGGPFEASTCGTAGGLDTALLLRGGSWRPQAACDDNACGPGAWLGRAIPAGAGLHALYVESCGPGGAYSLDVSRPP